VALCPQTPPAARRASQEHDPTIASVARDSPGLCHEHRSHATPRPAVAPAAAPLGQLPGAQHEARRELGQVERVVFPGAAQAQWIVVGIEVWHVREPPYRPDKESARRIAANSSKRL
jgi:hypothetical protein